MISKKKLTSLWLENEKIKIIDQTKLPFKLSILNLKNLSDYISAINEMKVRGAPLIGVTAAFGLAESIKKDPNNKNIESSYKKLLETRPTAVNLKWALDKIKTEVEQLNFKAQKLKVAPWTNSESDMGPVISKEHKGKIENYIASGISEGAKIILDGRNYSIQGYENGYFLGPALFDNVTKDMKIYKE